MRQPDSKLTADEKDALKQRIFDQLGLPQPGEDTFVKTETGKNSKRYLLAAAAAVLIFGSLFFINQKKGFVQPESVVAKTIIKTKAGETRRILLPDSSIVLLNAGSTLTWTGDFLSGTGREVSLEGNAFFDVRKLLNRKNFTVRTGSLSIAVLGTEFNVNARSAATEVSLIRGKVEVSRTGEHKVSAVLHPGERVRLDTASAQLVASPLNLELYSAWTDNKWKFSRTRLEDIMSLVHDYYGVAVVFENERKKELKITASMTVAPLPELISVIENTLQIKIDLENNRLLVR